MRITTLKVDGGMTKNNLLMQHQADVLGVPLIRPRVSETTCLGAAYAAGLATGVERPRRTQGALAAGRRVGTRHGGVGAGPRVPQLAQGRGEELRLDGGRRRGRLGAGQARGHARVGVVAVPPSRHGDDPAAVRRLAMACWTTPTRTSLTDSRSRASHITRGTSASRSRAWRTVSAG